jgi:thioredoxin-like negative regulator of GroEL
MNRRQMLSFVAVAGAATLAATAACANFITYSAQDFQSTLQSGATLVVHVHADWCPTCRKQLPTLQSMMQEKDYAAAKFVRVDFDHDRDFLTAHRVSSQSTILVFKGGKEVARLNGVTDPAQLRSRIKAAI